MDPKHLKLLLVEDSEDDEVLILRELKRSGFEVTSKRVQTQSNLEQALADERWDIVISDFNMPHLTGIRALELVRSQRFDLPFILVSGSLGEQLAVQAMKAGAQDYIMKDNLARLGTATARELQEAGERRKRREAEAALEEKSRQLTVAQRMESIGRLAGGIAHDLNNMIGACTIYAEMALDPSLEIDAVRDSVREIVKAQERSSRLVSQLLAFSRKQIVDPQIISLNQIISDLKKMLAKILGEDIELAVSLQADLHPIKADPSQVDQIVMNLVVNARDAMPKGGTLSIETKNETIEVGSTSEAELPSGEYICLTITDTGTGMSEETKSKIFEPFFTTKEVGKGTGLGLATVYGIVKQAQGDIRVRSELGKGTAFKILLRAADAPSPEVGTRSTISEAKPQQAIQTLLLVEDEHTVQNALRLALTRLGYRVELASNGEEGLRVFESHSGKFDLVVSDVVMPKMSGPDMVQEMRKKFPSLKVLFLSGYNNEFLSSYGIDRKCTFVLPKPFGIRQLTQKIAQIMGNPE